MDKRQASGVLAQVKLIKDMLKVWEAEAKAVVGQDLHEGERISAQLPDGTELGAVTMTSGSRSMQIDNEAGFVAWVKSRYPTEIYEAVRPAFVKVCEQKVAKLGVLVDANGVACPHVSLKTSDGHAMTKLNDYGKALLDQAIATRTLPALTMADPNAPAVVQGDAALAGAAHEAAMWERGEMQDTTQAYAEVNQSDSVTTEPEPDLSDSQVGPPHWQESNTFESSDNVKRRRD